MTDHPLRILFVCTANVCRSPLAAAILKARASERGVALAIASAGQLESGVPCNEHVVSTMAAWGVDVREKRSRQMSPPILAGAELIIAMTTAHARRVIGEDPKQRHKVFLFRELMEISEKLGPRLAHDSLGSWLMKADAQREHDYIKDNETHDIPDPIGYPAEVYQALQVEFDGYANTLLDTLFPNT